VAGVPGARSRAGLGGSLVARDGVAGTFAPGLAVVFFEAGLPPPRAFDIFDPAGLNGPTTFPVITPPPRSTHSSLSTTRTLKNFGQSSANILTSSSASAAVTLDALTIALAASRSGTTRRLAKIESNVSATSGKRARRHRRRSCAGVRSAVRVVSVSASYERVTVVVFPFGVARAFCRRRSAKAAWRGVVGTDGAELLSFWGVWGSRP
jgi:hypothetical protein